MSFEEAWCICSSEIPGVEIKKGGANKEISQAQTGFM